MIDIPQGIPSQIIDLAEKNVRTIIWAIFLPRSTPGNFSSASPLGSHR